MLPRGARCVSIRRAGEDHEGAACLCAAAATLTAPPSCVTIWPAGPAMGSSFNRSMWGVIGRTTGVEMRGLNNAQWGPSARPGVGLDGGGGEGGGAGVRG